MKIKLIISVLFISNLSFSSDIKSLRNRFYISVESLTEAKKFISDLTLISDLNPIEEGYKAATIIVMAKHVFNPYSKFKYFLDGKKILETVIHKNPENIELKLIRFAIQVNIPNFLGYNNDINSDKAFLLKKITTLDVKLHDDSTLKELIIKYLIESKKCNKSELEKLN